MVGIGPTLNQTYNYKTTVPSTFEFTPTFSGHMQTSFSYALAAGLDIPLSRILQIGLVYRFTDLGTAITGTGVMDDYFVSDRLGKSHIYANQVFAQISFAPWQS